MKTHTMTATVLMLGMTASAAAHDRFHDGDELRGPYLGGGVSELSVNDSDFGYDARDKGFKVFAGYQFNEIFAAEIGYLGGATLVDRGTFDTEHVDLSAVTAMLVSRFPLTSTVSIFAKVGAARYETDFHWTIGDEWIDAARYRDDELAYGFGLALGAGREFEIRGEYEAIEDTFDAISVSALIRF